jgi:maleylacetate reductase
MLKSGRVVFGHMEEVVFGVNAAEAVSHQARRLDASRVFLMVSGTLNRETDEIDKVRRALGNKCVGAFDRMPAHTPRAAVIAAANQAREAKADLIVTFGGGSITDGAKAVQLCLANDIGTVEELNAFRASRDASGTLRPPESKPVRVRQVSVPTTLSAGEFSAFSGVLNEQTKSKQMFSHPMLIPSAVILDPAATLPTPEWLLLSTGIRAVDHCVEAICSRETHAFANASSLQGLSLLASGLPRVKADPADLDARLDCLMGAWLSMGALAGGVPMGASHGIGYVLGALFDVPHGHTSCIMLPAVMRWNKPANAASQALVAAAMGHPGADAGDVLDRFIADLGMPRSLGAVNIGPEQFGRIAQQAMGTPWVPRNPRPIPSPAEVEEILALAA